MDERVGGAGFDELAAVAGHEEVTGAYRARSGLRAIVAIHSTALGPALGGTRFRPYPSAAAALADVLALSRAMSYKAALAGLPYGGGKAVIIGDPAELASPALFEEYAELLDSLGGRYLTAEDVGTTQADMDELGRHTPYVTGRSVEAGGSGDPSPMTAVGVLAAIEGALTHLTGERSLAGRTIAVSGVGKVGSTLCELAAGHGASLVVADVEPSAAARVAASLGARIVDPSRIHAERCDVFAPCALGGAIDDARLGELACAAVVGAANNQLARPELAEALLARSICYVPDYVANAGGIINIAHEPGGYDAAAAREQTGRIYETVVELLARAAESGETPAAVADRIAEERMAAGRPS